MERRERRLWGALAAITFGGLIITTMGLWPDSVVTGTAGFDDAASRQSFAAEVDGAREPGPSVAPMSPATRDADGSDPAPSPRPSLAPTFAPERGPWP